MSNILIIKLGSLGDIAQISGVLRDLREKHKDNNIFILTTLPYVELLSNCPYINGVLIDSRSPRWNLHYLIKLRKLLKKYNFSNVYDLQNSSRTSFYRKYILREPLWSSSETILKKNEERKDFDNSSVLERFNIQLNRSSVKTNHTLKPDFSWAINNVDKIIRQYFTKKFILLFPFCSPQLAHKKWPYFNDLINLIKKNHPNLEIAIAPGPNELIEAEKFSVSIIKNKNKPLNIMELAGLISKASFIIANDTGPAHITAHLNKKGIVIFGHHTTATKVSIETVNLKAITSNVLKDLDAKSVYEEIKNKI
jgi:ADP-heptose:LPS heptosyltransferase